MIQLVYSPKWFYGKDIVIDVVSILILFLIGIFSIKYYYIDKKNKNYICLAASFFTLATAFLFKILTNITIYYINTETKQIGFVTYSYEAIKSTDILFVSGFLLYRILTILSLYLLYSIHQKQPKSNIAIIIYLILVSTYFSQSAYYMFHITSLIILALITAHYIEIYKENRLHTSKLLAYSFGLVTTSQILFIFINVNPLFYVIAEVVQLIGYITLLITFILVLRHGKKKK